MKKLIVVIVVCVLLLCGCSVATLEKIEEKKQPTSMFVVVEECASWRVVYHKETKVMYTSSLGGYNCGNFTLLVNADGTPMLYKGGVKE